MKWKYKEEKSFEDRLNEAQKVKKKYPDRIPVIVEKNRDSKLPDLENKKFLVEKDSSAAQFLYTVRKRLPAITSEQSIFFFCGKHVVILSAFMNDLYEKYGDQDNFLYMSYAEENVFDMGSRFKWEYKDTKSFENRLEEAQRIKLIYPDCVPIIIQKYKKSTLADTDRKKYIVPKSRPFSFFFYKLRNQVTLTPSQSLFLIVQDGVTPNMTATIGEIYKSYADADQFLYICYTEENSFGADYTNCFN